MCTIKPLILTWKFLLRAERALLSLLSFVAISEKNYWDMLYCQKKFFQKDTWLAWTHPNFLLPLTKCFAKPAKSMRDRAEQDELAKFQPIKNIRGEGASLIVFVTDCTVFVSIFSSMCSLVRTKYTELVVHNKLFPPNLLKKKLWYRWFSLNFAKLLRTFFRQNSGRLLLLIWKVVGND